MLKKRTRKKNKTRGENRMTDTEQTTEDVNKIVEDILKNPLNFEKYVRYNNRPLTLRAQARELLTHQTTHPKTVSQYPRGGTKSFTSAFHALYDFYTKPSYKIAFMSLSQRQSNKLLATAKRMIDESPLLAASKPLFPIDQVQKIESHIHSEIIALPYDAKTILSEHPDEIFIDEVQRILEPEIFWESIMPMLSGVGTLDTLPEMHLTGVGGVQKGVLHDVITNANALGFHCLKKNWMQCEGYNAEEMAVRRRNMGEASYLTQYMCEMIPTSSASIPWDTINNNLTGAVNYNPELPCIAGLDLAKKRDNAALLVMQKNGEIYQCIALDVCQLDYKVLAEKICFYTKEFKISSILVDVTSESSFLDFATKAPYNLPLRGFSFGGSNDKKGALYDNMKIQLEYKRTAIPNTLTFKELIDGLKTVDLGKHLPDPVVAMMLALWNTKETKSNVITSTYAFVTRRETGFLK